MNKLSKIVAVLAVGLCSLSAQAVPITVQGITWDPDAVGDFSANGSPTRQWFQSTSAFPGVAPITAVALNTANLNNLVGTFLTGAGLINPLNGSLPNNYSTTHELTFVYGGIQITGLSFNLVGAPVFTYDFSNSFFNVYSDSSFDYSDALNGDLNHQVTAGNTSFGTPFLTGRFSQFDATTGIIGGTGQQRLTGFGDGLIEVTGGAAFANFNTNTFGPAGDLTFSSSQTINNGGMISTIGSSEIVGNTVPEPGTLALVGLALLAASASLRRKA